MMAFDRTPSSLTLDPQLATHPGHEVQTRLLPQLTRLLPQLIARCIHEYYAT